MTQTQIDDIKARWMKLTFDVNNPCMIDMLKLVNHVEELRMGMQSLIDRIEQICHKAYIKNDLQNDPDIANALFLLYESE